MKLLAIETSGRHCSAALLLDGALVQRIEDAPRRHADLVLGMMDGLLRHTGLALRDLDALAYGRGPGSFTGVRIGAAVVQGAAFGAGLPVIGVSTLAAMAFGAHRQFGATQALCALDARMGEVYWCGYRVEGDGTVRALGEERVLTPAEIEPPGGGDWVGVGAGWAAYPELPERFAASLSRIESDVVAEAQDVATQAAIMFRDRGGQPPQLALPCYLRDQVAEPGKKAS